MSDVFVPAHEDVKELQDCIKFLLFPDVGKQLWGSKTLDGRNGWFTFAKSVIQALGQGHERPTKGHFEQVATAIFDDIDLDLNRRLERERKEIEQLKKLQAKYPDEACAEPESRVVVTWMERCKGECDQEGSEFLCGVKDDDGGWRNEIIRACSKCGIAIPPKESA